MIITNTQFPYTFSYPINEDTFFLCIDTTGLQAEVSAITTIGIACYQDGNLMITQWFNESGFEQKEILVSFFHKISSKKTVITYYGNRFTLPFLEKKALEYSLDNPLLSMLHDDYYEILYPLRRILNLSSCRQSTVENYFKCNRTITMSGKKLIKQYQSYLKQKDNCIKDILLLRNEETLKILARSTSIFAYRDLKQGKLTKYSIKHKSLEKYQIKFSFSLPFSLFFPLNHSVNDVTISIVEKEGIITMPMDQNYMIKHYYPNPKDYDYLPLEDRSIHKSLSSFVSKEYKQKATADTCYEKIPYDHPALLKESSLKQFIADTITYLLLERKDGRF